MSEPESNFSVVSSWPVARGSPALLVVSHRDTFRDPSVSLSLVPGCGVLALSNGSGATLRLRGPGTAGSNSTTGLGLAGCGQQRLHVCGTAPCPTSHLTQYEQRHALYLDLSPLGHRPLHILQMLRHMQVSSSGLLAYVAACIIFPAASFTTRASHHEQSITPSSLGNIISIL